MAANIGLKAVFEVEKHFLKVFNIALMPVQFHILLKPRKPSILSH